MKKTIVEMLLASEKRKDVLLFLQDGPKEMEALLKSLNTSRTGLLPQMKMLKESHLIYQHRDTYQLTTIGKLITAEMTSFLRAVEMYGGNYEYLGTHNIDFIPAHLLKKLPEIGLCNIIESTMLDMFDSEIDFIEKAMKSKYWFQVTSILDPLFHEFYMQMIDNNVDVSMVINPQVYNKFKLNHYNDFKEIIDTKLISLYLYPKDLEFVSFILADECINLKLLTHKNEYDLKKMIICNPATVEWGKELFEYYRKKSTLIIEI
ncbi:MAG: winged helix-turn-helix domain-containing protein [Methanolobus sp.]|uniref:helix-turn-helix transcriptional regulator n=1 Tax=Methanolobus sp. TaxID=1874737 RepID=UPI0027307F89|nr:winged helix-turn-helix domain-containing protein [Methanolobus sp.]MDP2216864.1 winged helix-turn-helix domain-containing protein [Methanolobus sp.]